MIDKRNRLSKILDIPYFGRIDFKENRSDSKNIPIYIGIHTFFDIKSKRNLIYDWRAPISGMFYDYESDEATYSSPSGEVHGKISLKRQYRIRKGKMEYMIESSVTVHDDILQKELCSNADDKMRNIVTTIQREQTGLSVTKIRLCSSYRESPDREKHLLHYIASPICSMRKKERLHPEIS